MLEKESPIDAIAGRNSTTGPVSAASPYRHPYPPRPTPKLPTRTPSLIISCSPWASATTATAARGWATTILASHPAGTTSASVPRWAARSPRRSPSASPGSSRGRTPCAQPRRPPPRLPPRRINRAPTSSRSPRAPANRSTIS